MSKSVIRKVFNKKTQKALIDITPSFDYLIKKSNEYSPKFIISIAKYDINKPQGQRRFDEVTCFVDAIKFLVFCEDIQKGTVFTKSKKNDWQANKYFTVFRDEGGTSAAKLTGDRARKDGMGEARILKISPKSDAWMGSVSNINEELTGAFFISAEKGAGKENEQTGGIVACYKSPDVKSSVIITISELKEIAIACLMEYQSWLNSMYLYTKKQSANNNSFYFNL